MKQQHSNANAPTSGKQTAGHLAAERLAEFDRAQRFAEVATAVLADPVLSFKAKGVLCYLLSRPQGDQVHMREMVAQSADGDYAVSRAVHELVRLALVRHERDGFAWVTAVDTAALAARYGRCG